MVKPFVKTRLGQKPIKDCEMTPIIRDGPRCSPINFHRGWQLRDHLCPFCGSSRASAPSSRSTSWIIIVVLALAACSRPADGTFVLFEAVLEIVDELIGDALKDQIVFGDFERTNRREIEKNKGADPAEK